MECSKTHGEAPIASMTEISSVTVSNHTCKDTRTANTRAHPLDRCGRGFWGWGDCLCTGSEQPQTAAPFHPAAMPNPDHSAGAGTDSP